MSTALAVCEAGSLAPQEEELFDRCVVLIDRIGQIQGPVEVSKTRVFADAVEAAARAMKSRSLANRAAELRARAEHRAGLLRKAGREAGVFACISGQEGKAGSTYDFDYSVGISGHLGAKWENFAAISADVLDAALEEVAAAGEITTHKVWRRATGLSTVRIEPGIYRLPSGVLQIRWKERGGLRRSEALQHVTNLATARKHLLERRGRKAGRAANVPSKLDYAYGSLRSLISSIDGALDTLSPSARTHATEAITALHRAEDHLSRARMAEEFSEAREDEAA